MMTISAVTTPGRLTMRNASLKDLIKAAWSLEDYQVTAGPPWMASTRFDVEGKSADGAGRERLLVMLRGLLSERFRLEVHRETKEMAVYSMVVAKGGPKFRSLKPEEVGCWPACPGAKGTVNHLRQKDLPSLARFLTRLGSDRPVIDKTGLAGSFDIDVDISNALEGGDGPPTNLGMFEAIAGGLERALGLRLVPARAPVEVLVVDRVEPPTGN